MTVDWQGAYEALLVKHEGLLVEHVTLLELAAAAIRPPDPDDDEAFERLCEHIEDYTVRRLEWQVAWTDADENRWLEVALDADREFPV